LKLLDSPRPDATSMPIASIGIELYTPLPGRGGGGRTVRSRRDQSAWPARDPARNGARSTALTA
jgi:hypothetical protein